VADVLPKAEPRYSIRYDWNSALDTHPLAQI